MGTLVRNFYDGVLLQPSAFSQNSENSLLSSESEEEAKSQKQVGGKTECSILSTCPATNQAINKAALVDLEFKKYRKAKTRFLLSLVHDNKTYGTERKLTRPKCDIDILDIDELRETIVLRDLNYNANSGCKENKRPEKSKIIDSQSRSKLKSDEKCDNIGQMKSLLESTESSHLRTEQLSQIVLSPEMGNLNKVGEDGGKDLKNSKDQSKDGQKAESDRRAKLRKTYRWERFQFGKVGEEESISDLESCAARAWKAILNSNKRKEIMADRLFNVELRTNIGCMDSFNARDVRFPPISQLRNIGNKQLPLPVEPKVVVVPKPLVSPSASESMPSEDPEHRNRLVPEKVEESNKVDEEGIKEGKIKKDKKKKKRRDSSSSSEDLETLERRSEARLGLRK